MMERMVLLGASGDLTSRLLMPTVAQLAEARLLPHRFTILGAAKTDWSTYEFRQHIAGELEKHAAVAPETRDAVVRMLSFQPADVTRPEEVCRLIGDENDRPATLALLARSFDRPRLPKRGRAVAVRDLERQGGQRAIR
jgi:glucose-6-phosphate 1-dehydrogenase